MTSSPISTDAIAKTVAEALAEDVGAGDLTAALIPGDATALARISTRDDCILCGADWFSEVFHQLDEGVAIQWNRADGDEVTAGEVVCLLTGAARALLTGERTALNFLQTLSATATAARRFVDAVAGTGAKILDTRKTIPGLRAAQKYAVRCGGALNHRQGLYDAILIKENHIAAAGGLRQAVEASRQKTPSVLLVAEVENFS